jgi:hypothetical protein
MRLNRACPGRFRSTAWLHAKLATIFGADLIGLWVGEDLVVDGSNNVTSWPGRVGNSLVPVVAGVYRSASTINGRRATNASGNDFYRGLGATTTLGAKSFICVTNVAAVPLLALTCLASHQSDVHSIAVQDPGGSSFYTGSGWSHYVNGAPSELIPVGAAIVEGINAANATIGVRIGCGYAPNGPTNTRVWTSPIAFCMALSAAPSAADRAAAVALLKTYYSIA